LCVSQLHKHSQKQPEQQLATYVFAKLMETQHAHIIAYVFVPARLKEHVHVHVFLF
jgi:hypothetical protein